MSAGAISVQIGEIKDKNVTEGAPLNIVATAAFADNYFGKKQAVDTSWLGSV